MNWHWFLIACLISAVSNFIYVEALAKEVQIGYDAVKTTQKIYKGIAPFLGLAMKELPLFIPVIGPYIEVGIQLLEQIEKLDEKLNPPSDKNQVKLDHHFKELGEKVDAVNTRLGSFLYVLPNEISRNNRMHALKDMLGQIEYEYNSFEKLMARKIEANVETRNAALENFVKTHLNSKDLIGQQLKNIHTQFKDPSESESDGFLDNLLSDIENNTLICNHHHSVNVEISVIYRNILTAFFRVMELTSLQCKVSTKNLTEEHLELELDVCKVKLETVLEYLRDISLEVKKALKTSSRDYWKCDASSDQNRIQIGPIFQTYIVPETNTRQRVSDRRFNQFFLTLGECELAIHDECKDKYCRDENHRPCYGYLRDCYKAEKMAVCLNNQKDSRRYTYINDTDKNVIWGTKTEACEVKEHGLSSFYVSELCVCTCDEEFNDELDRYFNLHDVISDIQSNMIVTGVRLVKHRHLIHIQIQQGELGKNGNVNKSSVAWKPIKKYNIFNTNAVMGKDYFRISWDKRRIDLDHLEVPLDQVVTGVRFKQDNDSLKLEIQHTEFNFAKGKLDTTKTEWYSKPDKINGRKRTKVTVEKGTPQNEQGRIYKVFDNYAYLDFTTSNNEMDIGSTVVPLLDSSDVAQRTPTPLSGISFIHRHYPGSFGILGLKITTYNFFPQFEIENASWPDVYSDHLIEVIRNETYPTIQKVVTTG
ncbi:hypothetical protein QAD02_016965 [Eretmocerus hayati]|uniref:Uncharacterized protein n=1 Tax=Eretmocerus hayati TaxID=131215 RepID=A0ACC2PDM4_9HYME|nr:hypothetical protein QAD02_016965 [Eretmocerus hayati]